MDFGSIIKRAWHVTWRFKALWILGLFAGATGGGWSGGGTAQYNISPEDLPANWTWRLGQGAQYLEEWLAVLVGIAVVLVLLAIAWAIISLAAQGGLVQQVNEVEEGRAVSLSRGWSVGFHYWGRIALTGLILLLPLVLLAMLLIAATAVGIAVPLATDGSWAGVMVGFAGLLMVLVPVSIVLGFLLTNLYTLALRFVVIEDRQTTDAISAAWGAIRHRFKDVFLMWIITVGLGIAYAFAIAVPVVFFAIGIGVSVAIGAWPVAVLVGFALFLLAVVLGAAYNTFTSALWTVFFRRLTGREVPQPIPAYGGWAAPAGYPPASPAAPGAYAPTPPAPAPRWEPPPPGPPVAGYAPAPPAPAPPWEPPPSGPPVAGYAPAPPAPAPPPEPPPPGPPIAGYAPESPAGEPPAPEPPAPDA